MKKQFTILLLFSVCIAVPILIARTADAEFIDTMELGIHAGYRLDQIDWNTAGYNQLTNTDVNVLSELEWENLKIWQLGATGKLSVGNNIASYRTYIRGSVNYGWITNGTTRDSDYGGDNRTDETYRSFNVTEDDNVFDASIGLGFEKKYWQDRIAVGLLGGYSYHEQNLRLTDLVVFINNSVVLQPSQPFPGLNSTYATKWSGPFAGIDLELHPSPRFSLVGSIEFHWSDFEAEADWNLQSAWAHPVSFTHEIDKGDGVVTTLKGSYLFNNRWELDLAFVYRNFSASNGISLTFPDGGGAPSPSKLNEANWQSSAINVGFTYKFK